MTARLSPVTPEVLEWALAEDGRDLHLVAEQLDVDPDVLDAWANGDAQPTVGQVSDLAKVLKRPRALFFMPRPPEGASLPASFRHPPGDDERLVGQEARRQVRGARRVQQAVAWALREQPAVDLPRALMQSEAARAAQVARAWLGVTSERQAAWKDDYQALREWRAALEERGVLVFSLEIGRGDVRGFSAWDDHAPLIVTNSTGMSPAVRCFTLMHELGHLMLRQDAACIEVNATGDGVAVERWCERFGAAVLMPTGDVTAWARERHLAKGDADLDDVSALMRRFRVSGRAAALRLIDMKFAVQSLYASVVATFVPRPPKDDGKFYSPPRAVKRQRQYGERVLRTVLNDLPARDALSVLRMQVDDVRMLAENVPGIREI